MTEKEIKEEKVSPAPRGQHMRRMTPLERALAPLGLGSEETERLVTEINARGLTTQHARRTRINELHAALMAALNVNVQKIQALLDSLEDQP